MRCATLLAATTFQSFEKLPAELQLKIWDYAFDTPPRKIELLITYPRHGDFPGSENQRRQHQIQISSDPTSHETIYEQIDAKLAPLPHSLLHTCPDSRSVALQTYPTCFTTHTRASRPNEIRNEQQIKSKSYVLVANDELRPTYYAPKIDTIVLRRLSARDMETLARWRPSSFFDSVCYLCLGMHEIQRAFVGQHRHSKGEELLRFKHLIELILIDCHFCGTLDWAQFLTAREFNCKLDALKESCKEWNKPRVVLKKDYTLRDINFPVWDD